MPTRFGHLYEQVASLESLYAAFLKARAGKRCKAAVEAFERNLGANLAALADELAEGRYRPRGYRKFEVREPKPRVIYAPEFRDTIVQHAVYAVVYPIFDRTFIHDAYGCRVGKGHHRAADQAQRYLRASAPDSVTLQLDVRKFFYRIDRAVLMTQIERKIKDPRLLALMAAFCEYDEPRGLPIGNLLSQLFASIYLHDLDMHVKRVMRIRRYVRFVDDFILFGLDRPQARAALQEIEAFLADRLGLELSRYTIAPVRRGVNFVGFRTWRRTRCVRKHSLCRFSRRLREGDVPALVSMLGNARATASFRHFAGRLYARRPDLVPRLPAATRATLEAACCS
ncbi:reverse transcriptase domain-containing protein [Thiocapsa sp. UBA6158]|jgi:retron-type reverse transcriptase|uniref:reverse transcriptase domain-containing protein n=1 Tax=Thiocapsa sp. UBA6158 TaxID=1947692 RepID=UPI0025E6D633|nr:reverse transcriptase domain-containing protein [Thiocapsa sp. UBA6158]